MMSHNVFITGTTRGIGLELTRQFLDTGSKVFAGARNPESDALQSLKATYGDQLQLLTLDVTDNAQIAKAAAVLAQCVQQRGRLLAVLGQLVQLGAVVARLVPHQPILLQLLEPRGEQIRGQPRQALLQLGEPGGAGV